MLRGKDIFSILFYIIFHYCIVIINLNFQKYLFCIICIKVGVTGNLFQKKKFQKYSKLFQLDQEKIETVLLDNGGS